MRIALINDETSGLVRTDIGSLRIFMHMSLTDALKLILYLLCQIYTYSTTTTERLLRVTPIQTP